MHNHEVTISIAMTTYNGEKFVEHQLRSLLNQTLPANEIIICDDGSQDQTIPIIRRIMQEVPDNHICLIENQKKLGYAKNFHKAVSLTHGTYIFLCDQDDEWRENKIERMIDLMTQTKASALCSNCHLIDENGSDIVDPSRYDRSPFIDSAKDLLTEISFFELALENVAQGCTYCFTSKVKDAYVRINSQNLIHDHQIMFIASLLGKVCFLNEALINYRLHNHNAMGFGSAEEASKIHWKIPSIKPQMVRFLEDLSDCIKIPRLGYYKLLYYLRIPYFIAVYRRKKRKHRNSSKEIVS